MKKIDFSFWGTLLGFALVLRIVLSAFLYHPDLKWIYYQSSQIGQGVEKAYEQAVKDKNPLAYPPPIYLVFNSYQKINSLLFSDYFAKWLSDWSPSQTDNNLKIFRDLFVMKIPIILADLLVAFLLSLLAPKGRKRLIATVWLFNPFSIYSIYVFSQFDIIPTLLVLTSFYLLTLNKNLASYFSLGVASGFKLFPILLFPFWLILDKQNMKGKILSCFVFFFTFGLCLVPAIGSMVAIKSIFLSNLTSGAFNFSFDLGEGRQLSLYFVFYSFFLIGIATRYIKNIQIESSVFSVLTFLLALGSFHPQWAVWSMPFLLLLYFKGKVDLAYLVSLGVVFLSISFLTLDKFVGLGIFKALNNGFDTIESFRWYLDRLGIGLQLQTLASSLFLVLTVIITLQVWGILKVRNQISFPKISVGKNFVFWIFSLTIVFFLIHFPLNFKATYASTNHTNQYERILIKPKSTISQDFKILDNNFNRFELRLKNPNIKNTSDLKITLTEKDSQNSREFTINGKDIGDDFNLQLNFDKFETSANKMFNIKIDALGEVPKDQEIILPYDKLASDYQILADGKLVPGSLSFASYYNSGNYLDNLSHTLKNIAKKI